MRLDETALEHQGAITQVMVMGAWNERRSIQSDAALIVRSPAHRLHRFRGEQVQDD